jgi:hypothetical protein
LDNTADTHKDLTNMVLFTGQLSDIHIKNMKSFPFIFFHDVLQAKLDYSIGTKKNESSLVSYDLTLNKENDNLDKRYKALESAIHQLFWKEVKIQVKINGNEAYKSE